MDADPALLESENGCSTLLAKPRFCESPCCSKRRAWVGKAGRYLRFCCLACAEGAGEHGPECGSRDRVEELSAKAVPVPVVPATPGHPPRGDCKHGHDAREQHPFFAKHGLEAQGFREHRVGGDGNCQFRAISYFLYGHEDGHAQLRHEIAQYLRLHRARFEPFLAEGENVEAFAQNSVWGSHVTLQACADLYGYRVLVLSSESTEHPLEILPSRESGRQATSNVIITHWSEWHYNAVVLPPPKPGS